ncbi:MAG: type II toxin-antitoxin system Phd/YefM family antitoxin [Treponema sp.]|nr:type II toxin-antitoxin system Phd/YefM family antitoxin [Treponema sp.]
MPQIRPVSDLKNKISEIETLVSEHQEPVFLTNNIESKLDEADLQAKNDPTRYTHEEVFSSIRNW